MPRHRKPSIRKQLCPPHSPIAVDASVGGYYVASCMTCELRGPGREDVLKAKQALDPTWD
jgi:hypothetical protein